MLAADLYCSCRHSKVSPAAALLLQCSTCLQMTRLCSAGWGTHTTGIFAAAHCCSSHYHWHACSGLHESRVHRQRNSDADITSSICSSGPIAPTYQESVPAAPGSPLEMVPTERAARASCELPPLSWTCGRAQGVSFCGRVFRLKETNSFQTPTVQRLSPHPPTTQTCRS